ncbi:MAG TPA: tetratricopeptide repeat protein [Desulfuromonadales bacterium]|nr:tetratricopeptide repeat protein [Desulfuromonadales bacterium]
MWFLECADQAFDSGNFTDALGEFECALKISPDDIQAKTGVALCLIHLRRYAEAIPLLVQLEALMPTSLQLQFLLGESLYCTGRLDEAEVCLSRLVTQAPDHFDAQNRLGRVYMDLHRHPEANQCFSTALVLNPRHVESLTYMGIMMIQFCQFDNALIALGNALAIEPKNVLALNNLGRAFKMMGRPEEATLWYLRALEIAPRDVGIIGNYLFALNYCADLSPEFVAQEHFRLAPSAHRIDFDATPVPLQRKESGKLRIGYVSGDFYTHSVAYFVEPILIHHDYDTFSVVCYSLGTTSDATTDRIKDLPCLWRDMVGAAPDALAYQIREDRIDILVDLAGYTADNRIGAFASCPAPLQVSWIGYPNTSGLPQIDYFLTDSVCAPPGMTDHLFSERLWRLPRIFCCYLPPMEFPTVVPSPYLVNNFVTFGSFNNFGKVTPQQIILWARILRAVPGSRLYLKSMSLGDRSVKESVLAQFDAEGVDGDRIDMRTVTTTPLEHLHEYSRVDIALDTYPYHGTTTTCEALWMGIPVISRAGVTHASRVGVSLLQHVGCADCIAVNAEDYVVRAVALAQEPARLTALRTQLRGMMASSALMDVAGVTIEVEAAFVAMYELKCREGKGAP